VVKVGGSLFDWPELPRALWYWLQDQPPAENLLIAGGGALCDVIRRWDEVHALGEELSHALCIESMGSSATLLKHVLATARERFAAEMPNRQEAVSVVDVREYPNLAVPHSWQVTSDSLAARVAVTCRADELVLLKSVSWEATQGDYVDPYFPTASASLNHIRSVNLRAIAGL
jgi:aspartokinase-like uncharacterized kinase